MGGSRTTTSIVSKQTKTVDLSFCHDLNIVLESSFSPEPLGVTFMFMFIAEKVETQQNILPKQVMADPVFQP